MTWDARAPGDGPRGYGSHMETCGDGAIDDVVPRRRVDVG